MSLTIREATSLKNISVLRQRDGSEGAHERITPGLESLILDKKKEHCQDNCWNCLNPGVLLSLSSMEFVQ